MGCSCLHKVFCRCVEGLRETRPLITTMTVDVALAVAPESPSSTSSNGRVRPSRMLFCRSRSSITTAGSRRATPWATHGATCRATHWATCAWLPCLEPSTSCPETTRSLRGRAESHRPSHSRLTCQGILDHSRRRTHNGDPVASDYSAATTRRLTLRRRGSSECKCVPTDSVFVLWRLARQVWSWRAGHRCVEGRGCRGCWRAALSRRPSMIMKSRRRAPTPRPCIGSRAGLTKRDRANYGRIRRSERSEATLC